MIDVVRGQLIALACALPSLLLCTFGMPVQAVADESESGRLEGRLDDGRLLWPPFFQGSLTTEIFSDHVFRADDPGDEISDTFGELTLSAVAFFATEFYLESVFVLKPLKDGLPGEGRFFDDHGISIDTLSLTYEQESFWISAGKGKANFGIAHGDAAGIWAVDFPLDLYAAKNKLGLAGTFNLQSESAGSHSFYLSTFYLDTSGLSRTWITRSGPNRLEDGGPSNTEGLDSFSFAIDGSNMPILQKFRYHIAGMMQKTERLLDASGTPVPAAEIDDEYRVAVAGEWSVVQLGERTSFSPLVEYVRFWNARGFRDDKEDHLTVALAFYRDQWNATVATNYIRLDDGIAEDEITQWELSLGYTFDNGIKLDGGYRYQDIFGESTHTTGFAFGYFVPFSF